MVIFDENNKSIQIKRLLSKSTRVPNAKFYICKKVIFFDNFDYRATLKDLQMKEFLPTPDVHALPIKDLTFLIPRILVQYLPAYEAFKNTVIYHIPHKHSAEMDSQSHVV